MSASLDWVVFDLGGVLVELDGPPVPPEWMAASERAQVWERWLRCPWVRRYERGGCGTEAFAEGFCAEWSLPVSPERFLAHLSAWPTGPFPGALPLLAALEGRVGRACFSNTNALHWEQRFAPAGLADAFDRRFLSYEMGLVKPDADAFARLVDELGVAPARILFLDDNELNVRGARDCGLRAERVQGVEACRDRLVAEGLLAR